MNLTAQSPATGLSSDGRFGTQVDNPPPPKWAIPQTLNGTIKKTKGHFFKNEGPGFEQKNVCWFSKFRHKLTAVRIGQQSGWARKR